MTDHEYPSLKAEWLRYSGLDYSADDRWLRDNIAALFDLKDATERQEQLMNLAGQRLTLGDLPVALLPPNTEAINALAREEFGLPPSMRGFVFRLTNLFSRTR